MATIDLSDYNLGELRGLQLQIDNEIRLRRSDEVTRARADIVAIAQRVGVPVEDLLRQAGGKIKPA